MFAPFEMGLMSLIIVDEPISFIVVLVLVYRLYKKMQVE